MLENNNKISIQGIEGSFHHAVALQYFDEKININCCTSFDELVESVIENNTVKGVMAIENSIAGSILPNYALIDQNNLNIIGEYYHQIKHSLLALPNQSMSDIHEVYSHPMALLQCKDFFSNYPKIKLVESDDTAKSAKEIFDKKIKNRGAIASIEASDLYSLNVIRKSIQTIKNNVTRFVIIQKDISLIKKNYNKVSLKFILDHKRGSLATILNVMSDCKLNLTKIQSLPVVETPGKYSFFVDLTFDSSSFFEKAQSILEIMTMEMKILGKYLTGK